MLAAPPNASGRFEATIEARSACEPLSASPTPRARVLRDAVERHRRGERQTHGVCAGVSPIRRSIAMNVAAPTRSAADARARPACHVAEEMIPASVHEHRSEPADRPRLGRVARVVHVAGVDGRLRNRRSRSGSPYGEVRRDQGDRHDREAARRGPSESGSMAQPSAKALPERCRRASRGCLDGRRARSARGRGRTRRGCGARRHVRLAFRPTRARRSVRDWCVQATPARMIDALEIRLLGPFEVLAGGRPANVSGSKRQGLLALLALRRGRVVGVDSLIDALWEDDLPAAPRNAVQHHVARLRAALGQETIVASPDGYALTDATVDALRFEELLARGAECTARGRCRCRRPSRLPSRWSSGAARRCTGSRTRPGSAPRRGGSSRFESTRSKSSSRRRSRSETIARSSPRFERRSRRTRSGSGCGGS